MVSGNHKSKPEFNDHEGSATHGMKAVKDIWNKVYENMKRNTYRPDETRNSNRDERRARLLA